MELKQIATDRILAAAKRRRDRITELETEAATLEAEIEAFVRPRKERIRLLRVEVEQVNQTVGFLERAMLARTAVSPAARDLRALVKRLERESAKKSITVAKAEKLHAQLVLARTDLQDCCTHPFVLRTDGYDGRRDPDDSGYSGEAGCVVCGLVAYDKDHSNNNEVMPDDGSRLVRRMIHEVGFDRNGTDKHFRPRLKEYAALGSTDDVAAMFFGDKRLKELASILVKEPDSKE